jgi:hypothetical protein
MKRVLISWAALLVVVSCSEVSLPTEPTVTTGKVIATVRDSATGAGIANVTVEVRRSETGPLAFNGTTNASGIAEIVVPPGGYWVYVVPPAGYSYGGFTEAKSVQLGVGAGRVAGLTVTLSKQ